MSEVPLYTPPTPRTQLPPLLIPQAGLSFPTRFCLFEVGLPSVPKWAYRGTSLIRNSPPPYDRRRALGIFLL